MIKTSQEIESMRAGGKILARVLDELRGQVKPGVTTKELSELASQLIADAGGKPTFLGYDGFPAALCVSVNDQIVHGIPGDRAIKTGDIVGLDLGVTYQGLITDGAITVPVGDVSSEARKLLEATQAALSAGLAQVKAGVRVGDVGAAIEASVKRVGLSVVERLSGHGVGHELHEDPDVQNFGTAGTGAELEAGMTIAVEPMVSVGSGKIRIERDNWTVATADGSLAAQFEHTVLVTKSGSEILTKL